MTSRLMGFLREAPAIVFPLVSTVAAAALALYLLNLVPSHIQSSSRVRVYRSVEEAQSELGIRIALPSYFPDYLVWPPASVTVQRKPVLLISLLFLSQDGRSGALQIQQIMGEGSASLAAVPKPKAIWEETPVNVKGNAGWLIQGTDEKGQPFNQLRWKVGERRLIVTTIYPARELWKIALSMNP